MMLDRLKVFFLGVALKYQSLAVYKVQVYALLSILQRTIAPLLFFLLVLGSVFPEFIFLSFHALLFVKYFLIGMWLHISYFVNSLLLSLIVLIALFISPVFMFFITFALNFLLYYLINVG